MSELEVEVALKRFPGRAGEDARVAVRDFRLNAVRGELVCLFGPSGCGKTTVLNIVAGLDRAYEGRVRLPQAPGHPAPVVGYVFQTPRLLPWRTVEQNIRLVLPGSGGGSGDGRVTELLEATGLGQHRQAFPAELSVGLARRAALARAFAVDPDVLLLDEPFASLDGSAAARLRRLLVEVWSSRPTTALFVTHDLAEAVELADRIVFLTPSPARVLMERTVSIPRARRRDAAEVEAERRRLAAAYEAAQSAG